MKLFEVTYDGERLTVRRESEEHLTGEQKHSILMTAIIAVAVCALLLGLFS